MSLRCDVIKVLSTERVDDYNRIDIRIVKWSTASGPVLEKRRLWRPKGKEEDVVQKLTGFTLDDLRIVAEHLGEIETIMSNGGSDEAR